jgi:imidazolonepropionase
MLIINIKKLVGVRENPKILRGPDMAILPSLDNAYLHIEGDTIVGYGLMENLTMSDLGFVISEGELPDIRHPKSDIVYDAKGQFVLPTWCDSHTHIVYAGSREHEFEDKIRGVSYEEIARKGGGILNSARKLNETSEDDLFLQAWERLEAVKKMGTGAIEIKSGYGLTVEGELKMLRVIKRLKVESNLTIKATFLAAHTYPMAFKNDHQGYIRQIIDEMLPIVAAENLADYIDVFCEKGFFSMEETAQILEAGLAYGLKPKIHANQLHLSGGVQVGVKYNAVSVDHLECMSDSEIECLKGSNTIATLLPTAAFFLRLPYQPARQLIDANLAIALATDYNPGSSPSGNVPFLIALSCIQMKMTPEEAINAVTLNGAYAMDIQDALGSITIGKKANVIVTKKMPSLSYLPYSFGDNLIDKVMIKGVFQ